MVNPRLGLFGKIPTVGDFVAHNAATSVGRCYQDWMIAEVENLAAKRKHLPATPVKFLLRDVAGTGACIGTFGPGRDSVGREFPLALFSTLDLPVATHRFASLPVAFAQYLDAVAALVSDLPRLGLDLTGTLLRGDMLTIPGPPALEDAQAWSRAALEQTGGQTILEALFGPLEQGVALHGLHMFISACAHVRGGDPGASSIVLDCPCTDDVQLVFWLRLAYELLNWRRAPPSLFWTGPEGPSSRLLISLGAPAAGILHYLADPSVTAERLWPIRTQSASAVEAGRRGLSPARVRALTTPPATAADLLRDLALG